MTNINTGGPAFPTYAGADWDKDPLDPHKDDPRNKILGGGMTVRDWFATHASEWDIAEHSRSFVEKTDGDVSWRVFTREEARYRYADAMLKARGAE